jgi:hypothetical protein
MRTWRGEAGYILVRLKIHAIDNSTLVMIHANVKEICMMNPRYHAVPMLLGKRRT